MNNTINNITILGCGTMGNGIAHTFAQYGFPVSLYDVKQEFLDKAIKTISGNLDRQVKKGTLSEEQKIKTLSNIKTFLSLEEAVANADLVIEAVPENENLKKEIFRKLDAHCKPTTIFASNTSSISITEIAATTKRPLQVIGMHFMNPVPLMKLVEVIRGLATSDETFQIVKATAEKLEKTPVEVNDYPGFVSNRVLLPMINEAIFCVFEGVAKPEAIDTVMKLGMNHPMGPLEVIDFIGLDTELSIAESLYEETKDAKYAPPLLLRKMVTAGWLGRKTGKGFYDYK